MRPRQQNPGQGCQVPIGSGACRGIRSRHALEPDGAYPDRPLFIRGKSMGAPGGQPAGDVSLTASAMRRRGCL